jgi:hypothetical protein
MHAGAVGQCKAVAMAPGHMNLPAGLLSDPNQVCCPVGHAEVAALGNRAHCCRDLHWWVPLWRLLTTSSAMQMKVYRGVPTRLHQVGAW